MNFTFGRDNLALTVFVPWDCANSCEFCTSKGSYSSIRPSLERVLYQMNSFFNKYRYPVKDVVFSGGEPMMDIKGLSKLIMTVPADKNIYINTTLVNQNLEDFLHLVNSVSLVKGVNISRHGNSFEDDQKMFCNIADDSVIRQIKKPVRINCIEGIGDVKRVLERWHGSGVNLCIRKDYREPISSRELHNPYVNLPMKLAKLGYYFKSHTYCNVCDTMTFEKDGDIVSYHRGLQQSAVRTENNIEINDLIIDQSGFFTFDWGYYNSHEIISLENTYRVNNILENLQLTNMLRRDLQLTDMLSRGVCGGRTERRYCGGGGC